LRNSIDNLETTLETSAKSLPSNVSDNLKQRFAAYKEVIKKQRAWTLEFEKAIEKNDLEEFRRLQNLILESSNLIRNDALDLMKEGITKKTW
jgi:mevalonate kinase